VSQRVLSETVLGKEHPSTLTSTNNLVTVLIYQGKYEQAEEMHRQALGLSETVLSKEYPDTDEHGEPGDSAEQSEQVQAGRRDASTGT
jgi:hypothetical protein